MAMDRSVKTIAAVQGASSTVVRDMFSALVARWRSSARIAGVLEENHGQENQVCGAGYLRSIASGARYSMFQDLGPGSTACRIDPAGLLLAGEAVRRDIAAGCDLVLLNRFAKLEAERQGLISAFAAAVEAGVPLLTSVSPAFQGAWKRFAAPLFVMIPAEPETIDGWWRAVRASAFTERKYV
jgi:Protein of unknown function (DUF2478)